MSDTTLGLNLEIYTGLCSEDAPSTEVRSQEACLIESLRAGDERAFELLVERYQQPVYSLVYRLLDDSSESPDVVQEVFLKIFRNIGSFRGNSSLKTWIYRIAFNEAYNHRRWFTRHKKQEVGMGAEDADSLSYEDVLPDRGRSAFDLVLDHETYALIEEALGHVNPDFRAAVVLRDIEDLSYEEIAEILQVSLGTVKSRILRGREALKKVLASRLRPEPALEFAPNPVR